MGLLGRYVFRTTMGAFVVITVSLTVVFWFTQVMREFDLVTNQRQTALAFVGITSLFIPLLVMMIAPIALVIAVTFVLNKLSSDSEIIVMSGAGVSPWRLMRPFLATGLLVSLLVVFISTYLSPLSLQRLRDRLTEVRADILTNIVQPGRFTAIGGNLTFHIADRRPGGLLLGIFIDDQRDPKEHVTYLAERGEIVKNATGSFLVLEGGNVQRLQAGQRDPRIVTFVRYAFDLSKFGGPRSSTYSAHEKYTWELLSQPKEPAEQAQYRVELHDRLAAALYPPAFVILAYAFLGAPQTTRQSRTLALMGMVGAVSVLRTLGFLSIIIGVQVPAILSLQYIALAVTVVAGLWQISRGVPLEPAAAVSKLATAVSKRMTWATAS
jgi:lipopolysaccharide export system permease protein